MSRSGWKPCLVAVALSAWLGTAAEAQGVVPGGWSPDFTYQTFVAPGAVGGGGYVGYGYGYGYGGYGASGAGFSPYGVGGFAPNGPGIGPSSRAIYSAPSPQVVNGVNPLIGAIRRSTRPKGGR
jgi:hypothetical protein